MKRFASFFLLLVLFATLLAACGSASTGGTASAGSGTDASAAAPDASVAASEAPASASAAASESSAASASAETSASGSAAASTGAEASTSGTTTAAELPNVSGLNLSGIKIVSQTPLSGPQSALGTGIRNAAELAVEQYNERLGMNVTYQPYDDQATPDVGASNANQIAADQEVMCVAGHLNSGVALAALPVYKSANLTMVSPANTNVRITDEFAGTAYRVVGRDDVQAPTAAQFAADQGYKTVYVLHDKTDYGLGVAEAFRTKAQELGLTVVGFEGTDEKAVFDAVLNPVLAAQPDAVLWGGIYSEGGPLLKQMREKGIQAKFLGTDGLDSSELARLAGEAVVGVQYVTIAGPPSEYPATAQMAQDYQTKFNAPAPAFAPQGYDATAVCMIAIAKAAEAAGGKPTRQQVNEAMKTIGTVDGVTGPINFDEKGDRDPAQYFILEVQSSDPAKFGESKIVGRLTLDPKGNAVQ